MDTRQCGQFVLNRGSGLDSDGRPNHERRELYAWGYNGSSQLGDGTTTDRNTPVKVSNLPNSVMQVAVGTGWQNFVMAVCEETESSQEDGNMRLWTWGQNDHGFGAGTVSERKSTPFKHTTGSDYAKTAWITVLQGIGITVTVIMLETRFLSIRLDVVFTQDEMPMVGVVMVMPITWNMDAHERDHRV